MNKVPERVMGVYLPQLAQNSEPFEDDEWAYERKYDGMRAVITSTKILTMLTSRTALDLTPQFPEFRNLFETLGECVLDAEIITPDEDGNENLEHLQLRMGLQDPVVIQERAKLYPAALVVFDILETPDYVYLDKTYEHRRQALEMWFATSLGKPDNIRISEQVAHSEIPAGWEGIVAKRKDSTYFPGKRRAVWKKWKIEQTQDCLVVGFTEGKGEREGRFGALKIVARGPDDQYHDIGLVGSGFDESHIEMIDEWVRDSNAGELVIEVEFMGWTKTGKLREPRFKCIRYDKRGIDCELGH